MSVKQTLIDAKQLLVEKGVNRGDYVNPKNGCLCSRGALMVASGAQVVLEPGYGYELDWEHDAHLYDTSSAALENVLNEIAPSREVYDSIVSYNDCSENDEQIFELFDRAIAGMD